jgi:hypothetical protein
VSLFVYDNGTFIAHNFRDEPVSARVELRADAAKIVDMVSGESIVTTERKAEVTTRIAAFVLPPHSFRAFTAR